MYSSIVLQCEKVINMNNKMKIMSKIHLKVQCGVLLNNAYFINKKYQFHVRYSYTISYKFLSNVFKIIFHSALKYIQIFIFANITGCAIIQL